MKRLAAVDSAVVWQGRSRLDGGPIMVLITGAIVVGDNPKIGAMAQAWILRADMSPVDAIYSGAEESICGAGENACPYSGAFEERSCYVSVIRAPSSIWRKYAAGGYAKRTPLQMGSQLAGRQLRIGAYGDPAAVPLWVWQLLTARTARHTGYTHQWRQLAAAGWRALFMASCDSVADHAAARRAGWRSFRVTGPDGARLPGEVVCPASDEANHRLTCSACGLCNGVGPGRSRRHWPGVAIIGHGIARAKLFTRAELAAR